MQIQSSSAVVADIRAEALKRLSADIYQLLDPNLAGQALKASPVKTAPLPEWCCLQAKWHIGMQALPCRSPNAFAIAECHVLSSQQLPPEACSRMICIQLFAWAAFVRVNVSICRLYLRGLWQLCRRLCCCAPSRDAVQLCACNAAPGMQQIHCSAVQVLLQVARQDPSEAVRQAAQQAIEGLPLAAATLGPLLAPQSIPGPAPTPRTRKRAKGSQGTPVPPSRPPPDIGTQKWKALIGIVWSPEEAYGSSKHLSCFATG